MELSVIIPAYNEEERIKQTLTEIDEYLSQKLSSYEIIVVNDGSTDRTREIVNRLLESKPHLIFLDNEKNRGKGAAVRQGMLSAKGDYHLFMDADNAIKINHLDRFMNYAGNYDVVIGSIGVPGSRRHSMYVGFADIYRSVFGRLSKYLIQFITGLKIHDTQRAFKLFKSDVSQRIFSRQTIQRWGFDMEILFIAKKLGYKIKELPVVWINPSGRVSFFDYFRSLKELFQIKANNFNLRYN